jgi:hypothetical protein
LRRTGGDAVGVIDGGFPVGEGEKREEGRGEAGTVAGSAVLSGGGGLRAGKEHARVTRKRTRIVVEARIQNDLGFTGRLRSKFTKVL